MGSAQTRQGPSPWTLIIWGSSSIRCCRFGGRADLEDAAFRRPICTRSGRRRLDPRSLTADVSSTTANQETRRATADFTASASLDE